MTSVQNQSLKQQYPGDGLQGKQCKPEIQTNKETKAIFVVVFLKRALGLEETYNYLYHINSGNKLGNQNNRDSIGSCILKTCLSIEGKLQLFIACKQLRQTKETQQS